MCSGRLGRRGVRGDALEAERLEALCDLVRRPRRLRAGYGLVVEDRVREHRYRGARVAGQLLRVAPRR